MSEQSQTPKVCPDGSVPQEPKITRSEKTYKPKDPRRVEAGKRLAAISKSAKEKKARDREDSKAHRENREDRKDREESILQSDLLDWTIPVGGLIVAGLGALYYAYNKSRQTNTENIEAQGKAQPKASPPKTEARQRRSQLDSFDD